MMQWVQIGVNIYSKVLTIETQIEMCWKINEHDKC